MKIFKQELFLAIGAGALCNLAFAPLHFFLAAIISLSFFYFLLEEKKSSPQIFWLGWGYGFGYFVAGIYWITISLLVDAASFAWLIPFALILIPAALALYFALFALLYNFLKKKFFLDQNYQKIIIFSCCWIVFEILRAFLFTGFPWNLLGYIWSFDDNLIQAASIFGIWGLSFFAVLISLLPVLFFKIENKKLRKKFLNRNDKTTAIALLAILMANFIFGFHRLADKKINNDESLKLRLVQGNIEQEMKWNAREKYHNFFKHIELTNSQEKNDLAAVIWSETAVPYAIDSNPELLEKLKLATPDQGALITGALRLKYSQNGEVEQIWNSIFALDNSGVIASYDKHHLVPFGEYVPLQKYLPFINKITDGAIGFSKGEGAKTIHTRQFSFSPLLCYEVIFPDKIIDKNDRPDLLINLTNDAWFGNSSGPYQHLDAAKMRAVEYGISLARVANTGITAFFDPFGRLQNKINLNQEKIIDVNLIRKVEPTIYSKYSFAPLFLLIFLCLIIIFFTHKKNVTR
ncbi:MAG: apolipoprotein N-acyltransferase [Rickettsiales bacterium]|nr:apolipoprotein N-acyltransferase [Rickettsiales bacterium]